MTILAYDKARSIGHFDMYPMSLDGEVKPYFTRINTETGVILNCDNRIEPAHITRVLEMARANPDYPYDLCAYVGQSGERRLVWNARIFWREFV